MPDARISTALPTHPKTKKLIRRMGKGAAWDLIRLFLWAAENRSDGDLSGMTDDDLELAIDYDGEEGSFIKCLVEFRFLDGEPGARSIHDWAEHNPWAAGAGKRAEKSRWAALCKQYGRHEAALMMPDYAARLPKPENDKPAQASSKPDALPESASGTSLAGSGSAPSPIPSPSPLPLPLPTPTSVPNGTGGQAAKLTDPGEIIFGYGLSMLVNAGTAEKQARSFLGGLRKTHGDGPLIDKLRECAKARPLQPLEWLAAALPPPSAGGKRIPKTENFAEKDYGSGVEDV